MSQPQLSEAYRLLKEIHEAGSFPRSRLDLLDVNNQILRSDRVLLRVFELFDHWMRVCGDAVTGQNSEKLHEAVVMLRIQAVDASSLFDSLAEAIEELAFEHPRSE